jgi:hypothetical protein
MPSIIPSYVYSLFAAIIVGTIIVYSCSVATANMRSDANNQQLCNIEQYVAAQGLTLLSQTTQDNMNTTQYLDIPSQIGNQIFTIRIANDSQSAWVESGFGVNITSIDMHVGLPAKVTASGSFVSGSGRPLLQCHYENQIATLTLTQE